MITTSKQKQKLLYLRKILLEKTDESHALSGQELIDELKLYGIASERKTIYDDIDALIDSGLDIVVARRGHSNVYYVGSRLFQEEELCVLADAVASSKFLTQKKSNELIKKLMSLTSKYNAQHLKRTVYVENRAKTYNETIYYTTNTIHEAIAENRQISFKYSEYDLTKKKRYRHGGETYTVSPYYLIWENDCYYLVCWCNKHEKLSRYRADRMAEVEMTKLKRRELSIDEESFAKSLRATYNMYGGTEASVVLEMSNNLINVVIDRYGESVHPNPISADRFTVRVDVQVSPTFWGWLFQFGTEARVIAPKWVVNEAKQKIEEIRGAYRAAPVYED